MKKLLRFLVSRVFWFSLLIILQIAVTVILLLNISGFSTYINAAFKLLSLAVVVWLTTKNDNPSYKITWIILILTMPLLGGLFYLKFGNKSMPRRFREQTAAHHKKHPILFAEEIGDTDRLLQQYPQYGVQTDYIRQVSAFPA